MRAALMLLVLFAAAGGIILAARENPVSEESEISRPIIAQIFANPEKFAGRKVEIYGLVIKSDSNSEFVLQDVSQRPLRVLGRASVGDQVTVAGTIQANAVALYLAAESLTSTRVLGGGGCC